MKKALKVSIASAAMIAGVAGLAGWSSMNAVGTTSTASESAAVRTESNLRSRTYEVDPVHTNVLFKIRHGSVSNFYGRFNTVEGTIEFDKLHIERSSMSFTVQTGSVDTNSRTRDGHIKGADFFNARQFPEATFTSTSIEEIGEGEYKLIGEFTLQGKTVTIEANMHDIRTGKFRDFDVLGVEATFTLKRSDFGITKYLDAKNPEMGPLGDVVEITVAIEAVGQ
ncbi:MAG: YceI family protein [Phycisphaerales bacterium]|nr:YceI family protein [Phycisphaerales bacterium]